MKTIRHFSKELLRRLFLLETYLLFRAAWRQLHQEIQLYHHHQNACRKVPGILRSVRPLNLELGGGDRKKPGWINIDLFSSTAELTLDLRRPLPFPDRCVDSIHSEHVLEHFVYPEPLTTLLQECFRVLKIGGVFESGVPDFGKAFNLYSQGNEERFYAQKFWDSPNPNWCKGPIDELNWLVYMGGQHHFMFDNQNLVEILVEAGFDQVHLREYDPVFDSEERKHQSLYVKAIKTTSQSLNQAVHTGLQNNDAFAYDALWGNEGAVRLYAGPSRRLLWQQLARIAVDMEGVILDMGCGGGHLLALLSQQPGRRPEDLYGTDYSGEAIKLAHKQIPGAHLMKVTVYHLDFPANYFNIVFACETLEHLADPAAALKEGYRVLKPGGRFIITIPNGALDNWPGHAHFWDESQFRKFSRDYPIVHFEVLEQGLTLLFIFQKEAGN